MVAAWLLRSQSFETVIANWSPVSFTGVPLALSVQPASMLILATWATVYFVNMLALPNQNVFESHPTASALLIPALAVVALANNLITLLVGLGLTDVLSAYLAIRRRQNPRHVLALLLFNGVSSACLLIVVASYYATGNSVSMPLVQLTDRFGGIVALALVLRLGLVPFRVSPYPITDMRASAGFVAGLVVLTHLPELGLSQLHPWFFALAAFSALGTLLVGLFEESDDNIPAVMISTGAYLAAGSAVVGQPIVTACAAAAWLLGSTVVLTPALMLTSARTQWLLRGVRGLGAACLMGLVFTAGFVGQSGVMSATAGLGPLGFISTVARLLAFVLFGYALIHLVTDDISPDSTQGSTLSRNKRVLVGVGVAALAIVFIGLTVRLGDAFARNGGLGWGTLLLSLVGAFVLWRYEARWLGAIEASSPTLVRIARLNWLNDLVTEAIERIRKPLPRVFTLLENDSALLLAVIIALLVVLVSRPGGP